MTSRLLTAVLALALVCQQTPAQESISLNGNWSFRLAKTEKEVSALEDFYRSDYREKGFDSIEVPSNWAVLGYEEPVYRGFKNNEASTGFYRLSFKTPEGMDDRRLMLNFGGVWNEADVWLNGEFLGTHSSGYTGFSFVITGKLRTDGGDNLLAVKVSQVSRDYKFDTYDDWTLGGIYRDVTLTSMPKNRWIDYVTVRSDFDEFYENADLDIRVFVADTRKETLPGNYPSPGSPYQLRLTLNDAQGVTVQSRIIDIPAHISTGREHHQTLHLVKPEKWTAETPYLYTLKVELVDEGTVTQTWEDKIGVREISTEGGVFRINGQAVKLRGVNRHDEYPDVGRATRREHWLQDITMMKEANINYVRCSHYTPAEGFIRLCDSLGIYLSNEVSVGGAGNLMYDPSYMSSTLIRADETVRRDINRASIVVWSVGNEDPMTPQHLAAIKYIKAIDPTRPVLIPWRYEQWLPEEIDMLSVHYWKPAEYDSIAGNSRRPIITTEYTHAYGNEGMGGLDERWKALTKHAAGAGAAIWMWEDQGLSTPTVKPSSYTDYFSPDPHLRIDGQGWDGIVDSWRNPTGDYWEAKAVYAPVYPLVEKAVFTPGDSEIVIPIQNDYDFTDLSETGIHWELFEEGRMLDSGDARISGAPHSSHIFRMPVSATGSELKAGKSYYAHISFINANGHEINRSSVELIPAVATSAARMTPLSLEVRETGTTVTVSAGGNEYSFDRGTGELNGISGNGESLASGLSPIVWRPLDQCEVTAFSKADRKYGHDLGTAVAGAKKFEISEEEDLVRIDAETTYTVAPGEYYNVTWRYLVRADGSLSVHYELLPHLGITQLPIAGMTLSTAAAPESLAWLGYGETDSWPYRQKAAIFGYWGGKADSGIGNKAARRVDLDFGETGLSAEFNGYLWRSPENPSGIHLLSEVFARPEKGRQAGEEMPQLRTDNGQPFAGDIIIRIFGL